MKQLLLGCRRRLSRPATIIHQQQQPLAARSASTLTAPAQPPATHSTQHCGCSSHDHRHSNHVHHHHHHYAAQSVPLRFRPPPSGQRSLVTASSAISYNSGLSADRSPSNTHNGQQPPARRSSPINNSTFVSSHYRVDASELHRYLTQRKGYTVREHAEQYVIKDCPFCPPIKAKEDNQWKLYVWRDTGSYFCHRCGSKGSYFDLKKRLGDINDIQSMSSLVGGSGSAAASSTAAGAKQQRTLDQDTVQKYHHELMLALHNEKHKYYAVLNYLLQVRGLSVTTLEQYGIGCMDYTFINEESKQREVHACITFPFARSISKGEDDESNADNISSAATSKQPEQSADQQPPPYVIERLKIRSFREKRLQRLLPSGGAWQWFGFHTVPADAEHIIITEGEFDAMACYQATGLPTISLPNGAKSLPVELLPSLERFKRIYLWMDSDNAGQESVDKFVRKLGIGRCLIVRNPTVYDANGLPIASATGPKDANDALLQGVDIKAMVRLAQPVPHEQITTFAELRADILRELQEPERSRGIPSQSLPSLNRILKGHRRGELTILTGPTGAGKTTVLSQLSLDYCAQNVVTLWGSFEIKNSRLARTMLSQYAGTNFLTQPHHLQYFNRYADSFQSLPMYFLRFFGSTSVEQVLDAMEYAVYVHDVEHVVLDNLQFMLSGQTKGFGDKFELQDRALDLLRAFATSKNVHITLVCHPRKEQEHMQLGIASIFGTAKATQEADNVIILQASATSPPPARLSPYSNSSNPYRGDAMPGSSYSDDVAEVVPGYSDIRRLEVRKNRYDGDLGVIEYQYHRDRSRIVEVGADPNHNIFGVESPPLNLTGDAPSLDTQASEQLPSVEILTSGTPFSSSTPLKKVRNLAGKKPKLKVAADVLTE